MMCCPITGAWRCETKWTLIEGLPLIAAMEILRVDGRPCLAILRFAGGHGWGLQGFACR